MTPELQAIADVLRPALMAVVFGLPLVLSEKLGSAKQAINRHSSQKAVAIESGIPEHQLSRKLQGTPEAVLNLRDIDKMPTEVQRTFHFLEILRLGLPVEMLKAKPLLRAFRRVQQKRSA